MKYRRLGSCPIEISAVGLGGMAMTAIYGAADEGEAVATVHAALDAGVNFIDTFDAYGGGKNEELIGRALEGRRDRAVLETKFGKLGSSVNGRRPEELCWPAFYDKQANTIQRGLDRLEQMVVHLEGGPDYTAISAGVLCGFLDFRFSDTEWREGHSKLAGWYGLFAERPSMRTSEHSLP